MRKLNLILFVTMSALLVFNTIALYGALRTGNSLFPSALGKEQQA